MALVLTFAYPVLIRTSLATAPLRRGFWKYSRVERRQGRWSPLTATAKPPGKPRFYKNPSRAIEKGGGFYVPGLQGPRLRFFVPLISAVFLALNHASGGTSTAAMTRSEGLAVLAMVAVLGTAILDTLKEKKPSSPEQTQQLSSSATLPHVPQDSSRSSTTWSRSNSLQWASAVVTDLMPGIEFAHFRNSQLLFSTPSVLPATAGVAADRVVKEQRPLYIAKLSSLPEDVTVPFLGKGDWSVFMVPATAKDVVVFASREEISRDSRRWLELLSEQIAADIHGEVL